jgi:hypothetical protein
MWGDVRPTGGTYYSYVARRPPVLRNVQEPRHGVIDSLRDGAGELVQSVANDVVPGLVRAIDIDEVLAQIDVDRVLERIDLERVLARIDLNAVLERVDLDALLARTELGAVISRSGSAVASRALDTVRSQGVGIDVFIGRWTDRILGRTRRARRAS